MNTKILIIGFYLSLGLFTTSLLAQPALRVRNDAHIHLNPNRSLTFGTGTSTPNIYTLKLNGSIKDSKMFLKEN